MKPKFKSGDYVEFIGGREPGGCGTVTSSISHPIHQHRYNVEMSNGAIRTAVEVDLRIVPAQDTLTAAYGGQADFPQFPRVARGGIKYPAAPEVRSVSRTGAEKGVKPARHSLVPVGALTEVAEHYGKGAEKYAEHNWAKGYEWSKSFDAAERHLLAFWGGEDRDEETGSKHLAAVIFHCMTLMTFMETHPEFDDRYKP